MNKNLDKIVIANAGDLDAVDFACAYSSTDPLATATTLVPSYDIDNKILTIEPKSTATVAFTSFDTVAWGHRGTDVNWCEMSSFQYRVSSDYAIDSASVKITLSHTMGHLPDISLHLTRFQDDVMRINYGWLDRPADAKMPYVPPNPITLPEKLSFFGWGDFLEITAEPFALVLRNPKQAGMPMKLRDILWDTTGLELGFDQYYTRFGLNMHTDPASKGIWGLGQRTSSTIFVKDGLHSQWNFDQKRIEDGKLPAANSYGTHPFWMYKAQTAKADEMAFVGVYLHNINAMDHVVKTT